MAAKKKGKKKKPPAPLAFAMVTVTGLSLPSVTSFRCMAELVYYHPASGNIGIGGLNVDQGVEAFGDAAQLRAQIVADTRDLVINLLSTGAGVDVPADRIAVTLL